MATVLIVDDATIMRINMKRILENLGHTVIGEAKNGFESIEQFKKLKPDFVTMDITMPEENGIADGIEATKEIMAIDDKAKVVMVTSHGEQDKVIKAIQNGASNYMLKPLNIEKLTEIIEKLKL